MFAVLARPAAWEVVRRRVFEHMFDTSRVVRPRSTDRSAGTGPSWTALGSGRELSSSESPWGEHGVRTGGAPATAASHSIGATGAPAREAIGMDLHFGPWPTVS